MDVRCWKKCIQKLKNSINWGNCPVHSFVRNAYVNINKGAHVFCQASLWNFVIRLNSANSLSQLLYSTVYIASDQYKTQNEQIEISYNLFTFHIYIELQLTHSRVVTNFHIKKCTYCIECYRGVHLMVFIVLF